MSNRTKFFSLATALLLTLSAQAKVIEGTVTDATGETIISASVIVKGTTIGTVTDFDGNYSLDVPEDATVLVFSYIGLETQEVTITGSPLNVILRENAEVLEEVVVTGYGTTKKRDLVTAVASVSAEQLKDIPVTSASEALQGKLAGVSVTTTEGSPDADVKIRVRGGTSLTQSNDPLYIVDGFPVSSISDIAPSDIASMDVLKDAAATAIYGAQGANGVIIITTKDSDTDSDKMTFHVDYSGYVGWKKMAKKYDVMDVKDFTMMQWEYAYLKDKKNLRSNFNAYFDALYNQTKYYDESEIETTPISALLEEYGNPELHPFTDWQDLTFGRTGFNSNQSISISGGNKNATFTLSYNRIDDKAIMEQSNYARNNLALKAKFKPFKDFTIAFNTRYTGTEVLGAGSNAIKDNGTSTESRLRNCVVYTPVDLLTKGIASEDDDETFGSLYDPLTTIRDNYKFKKDNKWTMNGYAQYKFAKHFTARVELGYDSRNITTDRYYGPTTYFSRNTGRPGVENGTAQVQVLNEKESRLRNANTIEWKQKFNKAHQVSVLIGEETILHKAETETLNGFGYKGNYDIENGEIFNYLGQASYSEILNYIDPRDNQLSFFARANYDYKGRYYLTATFRADASTRFEKENQWGYFPSVAAAWRISDESWLENAQQWLSNLKLRLSYGMAGNNNVDLGYLHSDFLSQQMTYIDMGSGTSNILVAGGSDKIAPNPHLKWETTITRDLGIDYGFFNERLSGTIDLYWNTTKDLIIKQTLPSRYNAQYQNIGSTENKGVEFSIKGIILDHQSKRLSYGLSVDGNIAYNKNKVIDLGNVTSLSAQTTCFGSSEYLTLAEFLVEVGQPIGNVVGYETDGYYTAADFVSYVPSTDEWGLAEGQPTYGDGFLSSAIRPGSIKFKDQNGDNIIDEKDKTILGNTVPVLTGGFNISAFVGGDKWGRIDLAANFTFSWGNKILNLNKMEYSTITEKSKMRNLSNEVNFANRYSLFNEQGSYMPEALAAGKGIVFGDEYTAFASTLDNMNADKGATHASPIMSHYVVTDQTMEDGSFLRLQNLTIGYTLPRVWLEKAHLNSIRIFAQGTNLFCATKYTGIDPEVDTRSSKNPLTPGVDFSAYPKSRGFNIGLNIQF
ncbi:MAG: TonB-dependent receptor [Bacteroides sp.]|nr:TonB-dependent receptor [Bacteroidales bacterium]MCM1069445.1 TonB-dependent receptor [Prevotella sp.]MCM1353819.1 TonB-dependent receptor [Bacteroides sp.]MCM1403083.1 TonB-dependent receptor [Bacteroides sp.]MCM1442780.1 TonB-dependent receptor [Muribaculum sp.]